MADYATLLRDQTRGDLPVAGPHLPPGVPAWAADSGSGRPLPDPAFHSLLSRAERDRPRDTSPRSRVGRELRGPVRQFTKGEIEAIAEPCRKRPPEKAARDGCPTRNSSREDVGLALMAVEPTAVARRPQMD